MSDCLFNEGDRVLAPAGPDRQLEPGTVKQRDRYEIGPMLDGPRVSHVRVLVEYDEKALGEEWVECDACKPPGP